ncbi:CDP-diacylglycerol--inositol 3-phosphatidyltransferase [Malassezia sp. CBS 17886]|nr:CDP-diacylglycerol--inositol 3-phosphatidyltransferase [Malassezia sp. CBS 17886]
MPASERGKQSVARAAETLDAARDAQDPASEENVFLFVPNLIGYARVVLAAISLYLMRDNPKVCTVLYLVSCLLDVFDGMFARMLDQSTKFGAVLDMVTDRCTTASLLCFLTAAYPNYALLFQGLVTLDFSSHYIHMYSSLLAGSTSHKKVDSSVSRILSLYYTDTRALFVFCAGNEIFFLCLYLMAFYRQPLLLNVPAYLPDRILLPILAHKDSFLFHMLYEYIPARTWPQVLGAVTFPICAGKQIINCVQFWKAARALTEIDITERDARRGKRRA